jgi:hypothetical protein
MDGILWLGAVGASRNIQKAAAIMAKQNARAFNRPLSDLIDMVRV